MNKLAPTFNALDLIEPLGNNGYIVAKSEMSFAMNGAFKYLKYDAVRCQHVFLVGYESLLEENTYYVSKVFVFLGHEGKIVAEYGGMPVCEGSEKETLHYIKQTKSN